VSVVGAEAQPARGPVQSHLDHGRGRGEGFVANRQCHGVVAGVRDEVRRGVFDHALFGFFGFPFFFRDFGAELDVFFVFDRAAVFFGFVFFGTFAFFARFGFFRFFVFFGSRGSKIAGERGHAQRVRRGDGGEQREQQQDQQEGEELAHRPFIGRAAAVL